MDRRKFEKLVARAVESLPHEYLSRLDNVDIVVAGEPTRAQLRENDVPRGETLLGLYEGIPLTERTSDYGLVLPDKITIFQKPIEAECHTEDEIVELVQSTVVHEIAHFFGIGDDRLEELGWA